MMYGTSGQGAMAQMMAMARKMSDSQLADVLSGKNLDVPQFVAMTEAMGRKQLRQAVDGAQAMQQAKQPSVKEQLLAEERPAGLEALPAENMENLAGGGIIAFEDGGEVKHYANTGYVDDTAKADRDWLDEILTKGSAGILDVASLVPRAGAGILNAGPIRGARAAGIDVPYIPDVAGGDYSSMTPFYDKFVRKSEQKSKEKPTERDWALFDAATQDWLDEQKANAPTAGVKGAPAAGAGGVGAGAGVKGAPVPQPIAKRENPFVGLKTDEVDYNKLKDTAFGEGLMKAAAGILSKPTFAAGVGAGIDALAESGAASRKEIAGLRKEARDYNMLRLKAAEAFDQGQEELAYKYAKMAQDKELGLAQIAKMGQSGELQILKALQKPGEDLNDTFARVQGAKQAPKTDVELQKAWSKSAALRVQYDNDFEKYKAAMGAGTTGDGGIQFVGKKSQ